MLCVKEGSDATMGNKRIKTKGLRPFKGQNVPCRIGYKYTLCCIERKEERNFTGLKFLQVRPYSWLKVKVKNNKQIKGESGLMEK